MKTKFLTLIALLAPLASISAPLTETAAVHTKPDQGSAVVTFLKAGTEPAAVTDAMANSPAGWLAVELPGPFEAYVQNKDLTKGLDVKVGANIYLTPKADGGVLAVAIKDDKVTLTGLHGKWTQIQLARKITGYIFIGGMPGYLPSIATTSPSAGTTVTPPMSAPPVTPGVYGVATPGHAAPMVNLGDGGSTTLPRQFVGKFISTRRPLAPRRPYDWALADDAGKRYAYLDLSKLLLTDQIENYANHSVVVFGAAKNAPDSREIVIQVESLQLK
jgi:hypothetical protein